VWAALPTSDALASVVTAVALVIFMRKLKRQHENNL
jgi:hypothetical protein